jgi:uncharacterized protein involved in exopolysaccharide biosynthesis
MSADPLGLPEVEGERGLARLARRLRRSWRWIAIPTLVAGLGSVALVQGLVPRYTGEAKILLESREAAFARSNQERDERAAPIDAPSVLSQIQVVMSRDLAREAIRRLKLLGNAEFDPAVADIGPVRRLLMMIGLTANPLERAPEDRVRQAYFDRLRVAAAGPSRTLTVAFQSKDPELAALAANTIAELYIAALEAARTDTAPSTSTWRGADIEALRTRVAEAEANVETYRARNGLIGSDTPGQTLSARRFDDLATQLSQARTAKADLSGRVKLIKEMIKDGRVFEIRDVVNNDIIRRMVEQRVTLRGQLALEARTLLPAHPRIKELKAQVADLDAQIRSTAERVVRTMENDARIAEARVENLSAAVDAQRDVVSKGNSSEVQLRALEREAKVQREQLEAYLTRSREASARDAARETPADARIVSRAVVSETPSFPRKLPIVSLAVIMALLLSMGGVVARHLLTDPGEVRRREPDEAGTDEVSATSEPAPSRAIVPEALPVPKPLGPETTLCLAAPAPVPGRFAVDDLLARLCADVSDGAGSRILFLEAQASGVDSETLLDTLAETLAARARTVVLDLNGPACGPENVGLTDLVVGEADFLDVIQRVPGSHVDRVQRGFLDLAVLTEQVEDLDVTLDALAQAYDWVLCRLLLQEESLALQSLLEAVGGAMDTVVIVSNQELDDAELLQFHALAEASGARRVLVARDRAVAEMPDRDFGSAFELRRSAA